MACNLQTVNKMIALVLKMNHFEHILQSDIPLMILRKEVKKGYLYMK